MAQGGREERPDLEWLDYANTLRGVRFLNSAPIWSGIAEESPRREPNAPDRRPRGAGKNGLAEDPAAHLARAFPLVCRGLPCSLQQFSLSTGGGTRTLKTVRTADFESAAFTIPPLRQSIRFSNVRRTRRGAYFARRCREVKRSQPLAPISDVLGAPTRLVSSRSR
jgi:hypothetical protein